MEATRSAELDLATEEVVGVAAADTELTVDAVAWTRATVAVVGEAADAVAAITTLTEK